MWTRHAFIQHHFLVSRIQRQMHVAGPNARYANTTSILGFILLCAMKISYEAVSDGF